MPVGFGQSNTGLSNDALSQPGKPKKKASAKESGGNGATGAAAGAASGAAIGSVVPGIGTLIGAGVGAAVGAADANKKSKDAASAGPRPKRRRLAKAIESAENRKSKRLRSLALLSQSVGDFAAGIR